MSDKSVRRSRAYDCNERYVSKEAMEYGKRKPYYLAARAERCIACGEIIPEGRQICFKCEKGYEND